MTVQVTHRLFAILAVAVIAVGAAVVFATYGLLSNSRTIQSYGAVKAVNVDVYWDSGCTNVTSAVYWGVLSPGSSKNVTLYVKNGGNVAVNLSLAAQDWSPTDAPDYMDLSWDREGQMVDSGSVVSATLTLSVSSSISGITDFSFDIVVTGVEQ